MPKWMFYDFTDGQGNHIEHWLTQVVTPTHRKDVRSRLQSRLQTNQNRNLKPPTFKPYQGYEDIYEIRFEVKRVAYRPLFCYRPGGEVVILIGAKEASNDLIPRNAAAVALERSGLILGEDGRRYMTLHDYIRTA